MSGGVQDRLRRFAAALLERRGALVDWPADAEQGMAILPAEIARELGVREELALHDTVRDGGVCVSLASEFLDQIAPLVAAEPMAARLDAPALYLKSGDLGQAVERQYQWINAKVAVRGATPEAVEYQAWTFQAALRSEDLWESLLTVHINGRSGAEVELPDPLGLHELAAGGEGDPIQPALYKQAVRGAVRRLENLAAPFVARMEARLERDRARLREYYGALLEEQNHPGRTRKEIGPEEREASQRVVELELRRKLAELRERYAIGAHITPVALVRTRMTVLAVDCMVLRRKARAIRRLYWNPLIKQFEPLRCHRCDAAIYAVGFSDDNVEPTCAACLNGH